MPFRRLFHGEMAGRDFLWLSALRQASPVPSGRARYPQFWFLAQEHHLPQLLPPCQLLYPTNSCPTAWAILLRVPGAKKSGGASSTAHFLCNCLIRLVHTGQRRPDRRQRLRPVPGYPLDPSLRERRRGRHCLAGLQVHHADSLGRPGGLGGQ